MLRAHRLERLIVSNWLAGRGLQSFRYHFSHCRIERGHLVLMLLLLDLSQAVLLLLLFMLIVLHLAQKANEALLVRRVELREYLGTTNGAQPALMRRTHLVLVDAEVKHRRPALVDAKLHALLEHDFEVRHDETLFREERHRQMQ